ncbi:arsenate reductase/protein-tyrosine-phosphatase family protein [Halorussus ruber]|uniref:arsenate reductase/protein-tyrosine-phosphatase family protein n=1 Tax=Halorussus ruber TaxID=1126238 RepID=UPI001092BBBC|nr:low molecular weight phosphotyrosine protein phosphatase [Halorussus ruber]
MMDIGTLRSRLYYGTKLLFSEALSTRDAFFETDERRSLASIRRQFSSTPTVLFLCYGNICRSPFAAHYLESKTHEGVTVVSSGFYPERNRNSPENAVTAARKFGVDLSSHTSSVVVDELLADADIVFLMDYENLFDFWTNGFGRYSSKTFLLKEATISDSLEIHDPYGRSVEGFRKTYSDIGTAIDQLIERVPSLIRLSSEES